MSSSKVRQNNINNQSKMRNSSSKWKRCSSPWKNKNNSVNIKNLYWLYTNKTIGSTKYSNLKTKSFLNKKRPLLLISSKGSISYKNRRQHRWMSSNENTRRLSSREEKPSFSIRSSMKRKKHRWNCIKSRSDSSNKMSWQELRTENKGCWARTPRKRKKSLISIIDQIIFKTWFSRPMSRSPNSPKIKVNMTAKKDTSNSSSKIKNQSLSVSNVN